MIDFPASPVVGQTFAAPNGVTYQWTGTAWITAGQTVAGGGDVQALGGSVSNSVGVDNVIGNFTLYAGNSGNWFNLATGRFTPPAGRYFIQCTCGMQAPVGGNGTYVMVPRKNGVRISNAGVNASGSAQFSVPTTYGMEVDANGTDFFDFVMN
jgi:hypothetical protein